MVGIINYGMGNLASVKNACEYVGINCKIVADPRDVRNCDKLILPGVGAFGMAMENLFKTGLAETIQELTISKQRPILGVCLGMQLLLDGSSEHGNHAGLGIVSGTVNFFGDSIRDRPVPHVGWNDVRTKESSRLFEAIPSGASFYFVHSYYCCLQDEVKVAGTTEYGILFHSSLEDGNVFGCQFHPEKSQRNGLLIYKNFNDV